MASRSAFGFRAAKKPDKEDKERAPTGVSRRASITSTTSNTSKLPAPPTSFFSRAIHSKSKTDASSSKTIASAIPVGKDLSSANLSTARSESGATNRSDSSRPTGLGISSGYTTVQSKSGKPRNVLRREAPSIEQRSGYARTESSASSYDVPSARQPRGAQSAPGTYTNPDPTSILGVTAPPTSSSNAMYIPTGLGAGSEMATSSSHMASFNNRKKENSSPQNLPPPTPTFHDSGSSTRRSESPGAFSRTSTPTSMSSQSPGVPTPVKTIPRTRISSPTRSRPPITRHRFADRLLNQEEVSTSRGLTAVRESGTSSSSSSTVKPESRAGSYKPISNSDPSSPRPLSPPSRTSSKRQGSINAGLEVRSQNAVRLAEPFQAAPSRQPSVSQSSQSRKPPPRPSRDGVPALGESLDGPPRQNARRLESSQGRSIKSSRIPEAEASRAALTTLGRSTSSASSISAQPSRMPSPNPQAVQPLRALPLKSNRTQQSPSVQTSLSSLQSNKDPSPQSAVSSKSSSRFGFFTRRAKSPEKTDKAAKKGPAAGTGHEGYGKYARRGRSGSVTTSASRGRSTSSTSVGRSPSSRKSSLNSRDELELDEFYRDRLTPRSITGGGQVAPSPALDSNPYLTESAQSSVGTFALGEISAEPGSRREPMRLESSSAVQSLTHGLRHDYRRLPHREDDPAKQHQPYPLEQSGPAPTLATRRSLHRSQVFNGAEPLRIPAPINVDVGGGSPDLDSRDTLQSSVPQSGISVPISDISEGHEGNWLKPRASEKPAKSPRKWKFFQRSQPSPRRPVTPAGPKSENQPKIVRELPATISRHPESRPVPFYALLDGSEQENIDRIGTPQESLGVRSPDQYGSDSASTEALGRSPDFEQRDNTLSMLLPSPPKLTSEFAMPSLPPPPIEPPQQPTSPPPVAPIVASEPRKPRLQQVGRIPRVVSKRDRPHNPPPQSFSRPRPRQGPASGPPNSAPAVPLAMEAENSDRPILGIQTEVIPANPWGSQESAKPASAPLESVGNLDQVNKRDEFLAFPPRIGSEVSGSSSSGILSFAATTAVVREQDTAPESDEIWNEYNDFLDTVESPAPLAQKTSGSSGRAPAPLHVRMESSATGASESPQKKQASTYPPATAPTRGLPSPPKKSKMLEIPPTPGTISDLLAGYGDPDRYSGVSSASERRNRPTSSRYSTSSIESEADSLAGRENSHPAPAAMRLSEIYLHHEALLASRWLSFDRVLFSPVHYEIQSNTKDRVLVLDGLGNDQWSYYCAENYPGAMIYNLSPVQRSNEPSTISHLPGAPKLPENHRHIYHSSLGRPFPFPQGFFAAAVFRFPAATSETAYFNAISEFKRVLRPGGYLEMSMLDIDMVNMGNLTRRALRGIKERKQITEPEVSLKPLSDNIQKMLGRKGFENLNRCMLQVPVNGPVNVSPAESFDEASKDLPVPSSQKTENAVTKNLAKVGRWWFTRCYEKPSSTKSGQQKSIWTDQQLLAECEAKESNFKLSLCYAQKPSNKRRTRSF